MREPSADLEARTLSLSLPPGRVIRGDEGDDEKPALWVSDGPATADLWRTLRTGQQRTSLCPLLLDSLRNEPRRPWDDGELWPDSMTSPDSHDPSVLLAQWWDAYTDTDDDILSPVERLGVTFPYGRRWPGLADGKRLPADPDEHADRRVEQLLQSQPGLRLGLVAATRSSDALTAAGWQGAVNHTNDTAMLSAVLRSWEDRFGVRVIGAGFADLYLSVAAPPTDHAEALRVAAETLPSAPTTSGRE